MGPSSSASDDSSDGSGGGSSEELFPIVYAELRRLARGHLARLRPGQTMQPTALVNEAYIRLRGSPTWRSDGEFFAAAATAMRHILVDELRRKRRLKRGADRARVDASVLRDVAITGDAIDTTEEVDLLRLDEALRALEEEEGARKARVVELRFFAGLTIEQTAQALGVTPRTVDRDWQFARAWLFEYMTASRSQSTPDPDARRG